MKKNLNLNGLWNFYFEKNKEKIKVPSNWYLQGFDIYGKAEYERDFTLKNKLKNKKYFINFTGVDYFADVYVNGKFAGSHEGYFQKFRFDITDIVKKGKNNIRVIVNSPKEKPGSEWPDNKHLIKGIFNHHDARPGGWSHELGQDKNTGGIWNDVYLEIVDLIEIEKVKITPYLKDDGKWNAGCEIFINNFTNKKKNCVLNVDMMPFNFKGTGYSKKKNFTLNPGVNKFLVHIELENPQLWWTWDFGKQNLYEFSCKIVAEGIKDIFTELSGIRELKKSKTDNNWYLNGKRIFLRGTNIIPAQWLSEYNIDKIKKDVKMLKEANLNIIRVHAHINRKELYEELDKEGIMVWQDFALQWGYETTDEFMENASRQIKEMINQFYNHPSIVIWCCHNEPFINEKQLDPVLYKKVREEDSVRYIEVASDFKQHHYPGWYYDDNFSNAADVFENLQKAGIITEYGAQALPCLETMKKIFKEEDLFPPNWEKWEYHNFQYKQTINIKKVEIGNSIEEFIENSQKAQADLIKEQTETFRRFRYKWLNGVFHFMFCECWESITWAVVDYYRIPKKGYFALKTAMQPLYPGFRLMTKTLSQGDLIGWGTLWTQIFIINDFPYEFKDLKINLQIVDPDGKPYFDISNEIKQIKPDCIVNPFEKQVIENFEGDQFRVPKDAKLGIHKIKLTLYDSENKKIAENEYEFTVKKAVKKMYHPYT